MGGGLNEVGGGEGGGRISDKEAALRLIDSLMQSNELYSTAMLVWSHGRELTQNLKNKWSTRLLDG